MENDKSRNQTLLAIFVMSIPFWVTPWGLIVGVITAIIWAKNAGMAAVGREARRARDHVSSRLKAARDSASTPGTKKTWWGKAAAHAVKGIREGMRRARAGARSHRALGESGHGPAGRIASAIVGGLVGGARAGWAQVRGNARRRQQRLRDGDDTIGSYFRLVMAWVRFMGAVWHWSRRAGQRTRRRWTPQGEPCDDCGRMCLLTALDWWPVQVRDDRVEWWRLCPQCRALHPWQQRDPDPQPVPALPAGSATPEPPSAEEGPRLTARQPVAIGAPVMAGNQLARRSGTVANMRGGVAAPSAANAAVHSRWVELQRRLVGALEGMHGGLEVVKSQLAQVNPGETHFAETVKLVDQLGQYAAFVAKMTETVDGIEDPIRQETERVGGPKERADTSYHAGQTQV
jgi:hypothetical protein